MSWNTGSNIIFNISLIIYLKNAFYPFVPMPAVDEVLRNIKRCTYSGIFLIILPKNSSDSNTCMFEIISGKGNLSFLFIVVTCVTEGFPPVVTAVIGRRARHGTGWVKFWHPRIVQIILYPLKNFFDHFMKKILSSICFLLKIRMLEEASTVTEVVKIGPKSKFKDNEQVRTF